MMDTRLRQLIVVILIGCVLAGSREDTATTTTAATTAESTGRGSSLLDNGISRAIKHVYDLCESSDDIFRCLKVQGAKLFGRALKVHNIKLLEGITIVRKPDYNESEARSRGDLHLSNSDLEQMSSKSLDKILFARVIGLLQSRQVQVNIPRLLSFGQRTSQVLFSDDARKKKDDKKYLGPFIAAVLLKAGILKMAYHSIAILAGKALIVGKIALIISAIIGLKKLVSGEGHEKTTYEIVKHPQVQQSHTYSSSHGEYEGGHEGGSYHRSIDDEMIMQDKAYRAHVPTRN
ncbi:uncharacterized protein LOC129941687 [Eupeodes corollae]|uniref:uncharacterized protein LOC129941687 n=1 Tax=Eupeodes corollae TaxID=290404 RepID=UPI002490BBEC|nr:uncharacterized protein LOC129941687 [Eupeodes corollae]